MLGVFLDTETTGLDPSLHVPLEIAFSIVDLVTGAEHSFFETTFQVTLDEWDRRDPVSTKVNGFTREDLATGVSRSVGGQMIEKVLSDANIKNKNSFFICQNPSFDRAFFSALIPTYRQESIGLPYHWLDVASMYWALKGSQKGTDISVSKDTIASELKLPPEACPHRAMNGVRHLLSCYRLLVGFPGSKL